MAFGRQNLGHAVSTVPCTDPDCELHHPEVIEDGRQKFTALALFYIGAEAMAKRFGEAGDEALQDIREEILNEAGWVSRDGPT